MANECSVSDRRFVKPCDTLASVVGNAVEHEHMFNMTTRKPSRSFFTIKSGQHAKKGIVINNCPFCGTDISAPVEDANVD